MSIQRFIQIDEEGQLSSSGLRVADENYGISLLENLRVEDRGYTTTFQNERVTIEAFDQPLVARHIEILNAQTGRALFAYGFAQNFKLSQVRSDMWDRFHARTTDHNIPFVFSRSAQMEFFNAAEEFDDESITIQKTKLIISDINQSADDPNQPKFWSQKYESWQNQRPHRARSGDF